MAAWGCAALGTVGVGGIVYAVIPKGDATAKGNSGPQENPVPVTDEAGDNKLQQGKEAKFKFTNKKTTNPVVLSCKPSNGSKWPKLSMTIESDSAKKATIKCSDDDKKQELKDQKIPVTGSKDTDLIQCKLKDSKNELEFECTQKEGKDVNVKLESSGKEVILEWT
ncbi:hypothetical protein MHLP_01895 [Candidatus Mycoplasma haematolamae str. Purdue]|uniref:Uncharacterized protein n=1 Tax=Mycoplasma haematolamae (strain Purdue) TaxID=1212765 RepID=I7CJE4_MYCHA|nr:hypothetical protein MHLP_01895 [Candidatus Mycoplasma haematolamae str. Purdue]